MRLPARPSPRQESHRASTPCPRRRRAARDGGRLSAVPFQQLPPASGDVLGACKCGPFPEPCSQGGCPSTRITLVQVQDLPPDPYSPVCIRMSTFSHLYRHRRKKYGEPSMYQKREEPCFEGNTGTGNDSCIDNADSASAPNEPADLTSPSSPGACCHK